MKQFINSSKYNTKETFIFLDLFDLYSKTLFFQYTFYLFKLFQLINLFLIMINSQLNHNILIIKK